MTSTTFGLFAGLDFFLPALGWNVHASISLTSFSFRASWRQISFSRLYSRILAVIPLPSAKFTWNGRGAASPCLFPALGSNVHSAAKASRAAASMAARTSAPFGFATRSCSGVGSFFLAVWLRRGLNVNCLW